MNKQATTSPAAIASIAALTLLGLIGGWLVLLGGGFHHQPSRYSPDAVFVSGPPAMAMAAIFFLMAAIGMASLVQKIRPVWYGYALGCGGVLLPPLLVVLSY